MKDAVHNALQELKQSYPGHEIEALDDGEGGAHVIVRDLDLGETFAPPSSWIGFHITHPYPDTDVYPHFLRGDVAYQGSAAVAGSGFPEGLAPSQEMPGFKLPAIQVSRRSNRWNPSQDTAASKLARVLAWIRALP